MTLSILQVGAGIRGRQWAQIIKDHPEATCVGLVEPDGANLAQAKPIVGDGCRTFDSLDARSRRCGPTRR